MDLTSLLILLGLLGLGAAGVRRLKPVKVKGKRKDR
jgi:hypothetical protein